MSFAEKTKEKVCKHCGYKEFFEGINGGLYCKQCLLELKEGQETGKNVL